MNKNHHVLPLAAALAMAYTAHSHAGFFDQILPRVTDIVGVPTQLAPSAQPASEKKPAQAVPLQVRPEFRQIRSNQAELFQRGRITGREALTELTAMRTAVRGGDLQLAMAQLYGLQPGNAPQAAQSLSILSRLNPDNISQAAADRLVATISIRALEHFFDTLTSNPDYFANETVELPKYAASLAPAQRQRVLILAASLIAMKGANKIVEASEKDFKQAMEGYEQLVGKREQAAAMLASAIEAWRMASAEKRELEARKLSAALLQEDMEFLERFPKDMKLADFTQDFSVQNIALEYLRKKGDRGFDDYNAAAGEYVNAIDGHLRKTAGLGAVIGFSALFLKEGKRAFEQEGERSILVVLPFADQFGVEFGKALKDGVSGWLESTAGGLFGDKEFRIEKADGSIVEKKANAADVVRFMRGEDAIYQQFVGNLYRTDHKGYLYRANLCGNGAADLLDKAVDDKVKTDFVKGFYRLGDATGFTFRNAFEGDYLQRRRDEVVSSVLATDYRHRAEGEAQEAIGKVQSATADGVGKWEARDLAKIIFASNLEGRHAHARLALGDHVVRLIPSKWMVFEYENYQQHCLKSVTTRLAQDDGAASGKPEKSKPASRKGGRK